MKRFIPTVLGKPVSDAWGVYSAALLASSMELQQIKTIARMHMDAYAKHPKAPRKHGQPLSDAELMRHAVGHFRRCAEKTTAKGGPPDCPYEHVVVVFASRSPSRDAQLRSIAPRVRSMLEHQYPQIRTTTVAGNELSFSQWQSHALRDKQELDRERRERERTGKRLKEANAELDKLRAELGSLHDSVDAARDSARASARSEQEQVLADLQAAMERAAADYNRQIQRLQSEVEKQAAQLSALAAERDEIERALFADAEEEPEVAEFNPQLLSGLRVLLLGGDAKQARPVREYAEAVGIQMLHEDTMNATQLVEAVDMVVFWIRYLSHPKYFAVRRECKVRGTAHCYWTRTSPAGLVSLIARARSGNVTLTG
jgi:hypothetical protein